MAAGSAVVLSDLPWVHELIEDGHDAAVVPLEPEALAGALEQLLADEEQRAALATAGRRLVEQHRDRNVELGRLEACYHDLAVR
jgi:glycosyltransferase involved in cell wall biosynthesis